MAKNDYDYSASELVRGAFVPSAAKQEYGGYFTIPRSTYQLCPNYVDSNGNTSGHTSTIARHRFSEIVGKRMAATFVV